MHIHELLPTGLLPTRAADIFRTFAVTLMAEATGYPNYPTEWGPEVVLVENEQRKIVAQLLKNTLSNHGIIHKVVFSEPRISAVRTIELSLDDIHHMRRVLQLADVRKLTVTDQINTYEASASRYVFSQQKGQIADPGISNIGMVMIYPVERGQNIRIYQAIAESASGVRKVEDYNSARYKNRKTAIDSRVPTPIENALYDLMINHRVMGPIDTTLDEVVLPFIPAR